MKSTADALPRSVINQAWIIVLGAIAPMLDSTMVNIALNHLATSFKTDLNTVQWVVTGYLLAMVVAVPFTGWLNDRFGGKKVFLFAELLFGMTSLLAAGANSITMLIGLRFIQGFAAGLITPLVTTLLVDVAGANAMGRMMAVVGLPIMLGPIVGPVIGGVIVQGLSWRWIFLINVPIAIIAGYLLWTKFPKTTPHDVHARFDWLGVGLLSAGAASLIYGVVKASTNANFANSTTLWASGIGGALIVAFIIEAASHHEHAVIPLQLFNKPNFSAAMVGLFLAGVATNGPMLLLPLFFQNLRGESVAMAGLSLLPQGIGMLLARPLVGRLIDAIGARWVTMGGLVITLLGTIPFVNFDQHSAYWLLMLVLFIRGIGAGAIISPLMTDAYIGAARQFSGQISVATRTMQNIGGAFGSALLATIVVGYQNSHPANVATIANSYQQGFVWAVGATVLLFLPALWLTNKMHR